MKHAARVRVDMEAASGQVTATLRGPGAAALGEVAILLDGMLHAVLQPEEGKRGARILSVALPQDRIFGAIDIHRLADGAPLLAAPWPLAPAYGLTLTEPPSVDGLWVTGAFTALPWLSPILGVELIDPAGAICGRDAARAKNGVWRFRAGLSSLPGPGVALRLNLRLGGWMADRAGLDIPANSLGILGCLDLATPYRVEGWALRLAEPGQPLDVDILIGADIVATITADQKRSDIQIGGSDGTRCGFAYDLPDPADPRATKRIAVQIAGSRTGLLGSPVVVDPMPTLLGRFDTLHGMSAHGWALDKSRPDTKMIVEAVGPEGEVLASGPASHFRGDLLGAGYAEGLCAFKLDISAHYERLIGQDISVRFAGTGVHLPGSPIRILPNGNMQRFLRRRDVLLRKPGVLPRLRQTLNHRAGDCAISIIMPVFDPPRAWLSEALESVRHQFCDRWELICIDDGSTRPYVAELLDSYARQDPRVRVLTPPQNVGVTRATNYGLRAARHPYVLFLDHDDYLEPDAVWQMIRAATMTDADFLYGDEALTDENLNGILEARMRPAFSHDYYLSHPYFVHPVCVRTELARRMGGWDETLPISADVDFVLRAIEQARNVVHVPAVLYRWRTHESSQGHAKQDEVMEATIGALQRHLDRLGRNAKVSAGPWYNQFRVDWPEAQGKILIVIPTKNGHALLRKAIWSIERLAGGADYRIVVIDHQSDEPESIAYLRELSDRHIIMLYEGPFNFSRMNNQAVARYGADADFLLFLNNDIEATQQGWIGRLASLAARPEIGAVGALLMYSDQRVQHAGVIMGFNNSADHALRLQDVWLDTKGRRNLGYNCSLTSVRDFSAVTAACVMMRRTVFEQAGGFDEKFDVGFNDTDLCLRIVKAGYRILYDGYTILYHYESATRAQTKQVFHPSDTRRMTRRWGKVLRAGDPFYNPNLSLRTQDHVPREDAQCRITYTPRVVRLK